jgi:protein-tyrosine phosphatase
MAEVIFYNLLKQKLANEADQWKVGSAGTWTIDGEPASKGAQEAVSRLFGLSLISHQSRQVTKELINEFNLILVMEFGQKEALQIEFPNCSAKVFLLSEMEGARFEIDDPYGGEMAGYYATARLIENLLVQGWNKILPLAKISRPILNV